MAARILKLTKFLLLTIAVAQLTSCATQQDVAVVNDPDAKPESMIPWNRQEKWEAQGEFSGITDRR